jgi:hypothetical protein
MEAIFKLCADQRGLMQQHGSTVPNGAPCPRRTSDRGPCGRGSISTPCARPQSEFSALESRSAPRSPNTLLLRAWRSLNELRIDDAMAIVTQFEAEIAYPQDSRLPPELRPYIESILGDRAQPRTDPLPIRASRITDSLSPREHSVLRSMSCGRSNKRIAQELQINCPRDSEIPCQRRFHRACRADTRPRRMDGQRSGTALKPRYRAHGKIVGKSVESGARWLRMCDIP